MTSPINENAVIHLFLFSKNGQGFSLQKWDMAGPKDTPPPGTTHRLPTGLSRARGGVSSAQAGQAARGRLPLTPQERPPPPGAFTLTPRTLSVIPVSHPCCPGPGRLPGRSSAAAFHGNKQRQQIQGLLTLRAPVTVCDIKL